MESQQFPGYSQSSGSGQSLNSLQQHAQKYAQQNSQQQQYGQTQPKQSLLQTPGVQGQMDAQQQQLMQQQQQMMAAYGYSMPVRVPTIIFENKKKTFDVHFVIQF